MDHCLNKIYEVSIFTIYLGSIRLVSLLCQKIIYFLDKYLFYSAQHAISMNFRKRTRSQYTVYMTF